MRKDVEHISSSTPNFYHSLLRPRGCPSGRIPPPRDGGAAGRIQRLVLCRKDTKYSSSHPDSVNIFRLFPKAGLKANARLSGIIHDSLAVVGMAKYNCSRAIRIRRRYRTFQQQPQEEGFHQSHQRTQSVTIGFRSRGINHPEKPNLQDVLASQPGTQGGIFDNKPRRLQEDRQQRRRINNAREGERVDRYRLPYPRSSGIQNRKCFRQTSDLLGEAERPDFAALDKVGFLCR